MKEKNKTMSKLKAIEICRNLTQTISKLKDTGGYESQSSAYESCRAKKKHLVRIRRNLMKKYQISKKEILNIN
tara:strand:+ start:289 stop:507 length:219 start_codon:yes stop_codon:yes gene_type:complete